MVFVVYEIDEGTVVVKCDGRVLAWSDGVFTGDLEMKRYAALGAASEVTTLVAGVAEIEANSDTALGALASMFVFCPERTHIVQCPDHVRAALMSARSLTRREDPSVWGSDPVEGEGA